MGEKDYTAPLWLPKLQPKVVVALSEQVQTELTVFTWLLLTPDTGAVASAITYCVCGRAIIWISDAATVKNWHITLRSKSYSTEAFKNIGTGWATWEQAVTHSSLGSSSSQVCKHAAQRPAAAAACWWSAGCGSELRSQGSAGWDSAPDWAAGRWGLEADRWPKRKWWNVVFSSLT